MRAVDASDLSEPCRASKSGGCAARGISNGPAHVACVESRGSCVVLHMLLGASGLQLPMKGELKRNRVSRDGSYLGARQRFLLLSSQQQQY